MAVTIYIRPVQDPLGANISMEREVEHSLSDLAEEILETEASGEGRVSFLEE